jgi:hypothetical protein
LRDLAQGNNRDMFGHVEALVGSLAHKQCLSEINSFRMAVGAKEFDVGHGRKRLSAYIL